MKKSSALVAGVLLILASQSQAAMLDFAGVLQGSQQVPPNQSTASGSVAGTLDDETNTFSWLVEFNDLTGGFAILGHFHVGAEGVNGPALIDFSDQITTNPQFQLSGSANGVSVLSDDDETALINGNFYVNIHSAEFPSGEIRGQVTAVPEPESWLMLTLGALAVGAAVRRKRRGATTPS